MAFDSKPTIVLGSDHAGFEHKEAVKAFLKERGYRVEDAGAYRFEPSDDYPDFIAPAVCDVQTDPEHARAIIFGYSGQGEAMVANRFEGIRAAVYYGGEKMILTLSREHNDANVLSIGAGFVSPEEACNAVLDWLETDFSEDERHKRRIKKIDDASCSERENL